MKFLELLNKLPKGVTGIATILVGAGVNFIPAIGPIASPYIMAAGAALIAGSAVDKVIRHTKGEDAFSKEKAIINKFTTNGGTK